MALLFGLALASFPAAAQKLTVKDLSPRPHAWLEEEDHPTSFGTNLNVLNSIGDCYVKSGDFPSTLTAWKKSPELDPVQGELRKKVAELQGKIKE